MTVVCCCCCCSPGLSPFLRSSLCQWSRLFIMHGRCADNLYGLLRVNASADGQSIRAHWDCAAHAQHVDELARPTPCLVASWQHQCSSSAPRTSSSRWYFISQGLSAERERERERERTGLTKPQPTVRLSVRFRSQFLSNAYVRMFYFLCSARLLTISAYFMLCVGGD